MEGEAMTLARRRLGGLEVSAVGLGCMGMTNTYGPVDPDDAVRTIHGAVDLGVDLLDTADIYGLGANEELVGRAVAGMRDRVVLATKFGITAGPKGSRGVDARPTRVRACCEASLRRLGVDVIDLYYLHRVDPAVAIEETVGAMADLVERGMVRHLGLSMASAESLHRASRVHPIAALQSEWSLWTRDIETGVLPAARALDIGVVPFSPLGRGFLSGGVRDRKLSDGDARRHNPRFQGAAFDRHAAVVHDLEQMAHRRGVSTSQLVLAWLLTQGDDVVPIPGTSRLAHLEANVAAASIALRPDELEAIARVVPEELTRGALFATAGHPNGGDSPALVNAVPEGDSQTASD
jgi:aryl-alcohol dehydrogenase-like predicted oxidoreductase